MSFIVLYLKTSSISNLIGFQHDTIQVCSHQTKYFSMIKTHKPIIYQNINNGTSFQVPAIMIPISCTTTNPTQVFPSNMNVNMPVGLMMQGTPTGFIPLCMGEPVLGGRFMYNPSSLDQEKEPFQRDSGMPMPTSSRKQSSTPHFELPNCLAVNSCMTHHRETGKV